VEEQQAAAADAGLNKRQRRAAKRAEEERVRAAELRQLRDPAPQSQLDFERLVRGQVQITGWILNPAGPRTAVPARY
jgi:hypothetical protein